MCVYVFFSVFRFYFLKKAVASTKFKVPQLLAAYQPHVKVLFLRHPAHALSSLRRREASGSAKAGTGTAEAKLRLVEDAYVHQETYGFDANVTYEELTLASNRRGQPGSPLLAKLQRLGFSAPQLAAMFKFSRSADEVRSFLGARRAETSRPQPPPPLPLLPSTQPTSRKRGI